MEPGRLGHSLTCGKWGFSAMRNRQRGVTFIGWLFLLTPMVVVIYAGIRIAPIYLNYMKVAKALNQVATEYRAGGASATAIKTNLDRHFEIDMINYPDWKDIKVTHEDGGWLVEASYDDEAPLFQNVSLRVTFDKKVRAND
jgi:hypothetical protein